MVSSRLPLGANVRGTSAWIIWQILRDPLQARIRQLEVDPGVSRDVVGALRGTAADLEMAAREYREWIAARSASESSEARIADLMQAWTVLLGWTQGRWPRAWAVRALGDPALPYRSARGYQAGTHLVH